MNSSRQPQRHKKHLQRSQPQISIISTNNFSKQNAERVRQLKIKNQLKTTCSFENCVFSQHCSQQVVKRVFSSINESVYRAAQETLKKDHDELVRSR